MIHLIIRNMFVSVFNCNAADARLSDTPYPKSLITPQMPVIQYPNRLLLAKNRKASCPSINLFFFLQANFNSTDSNLSAGSFLYAGVYPQY